MSRVLSQREQFGQLRVHWSGRDVRSPLTWAEVKFWKIKARRRESEREGERKKEREKEKANIIFRRGRGMTAEYEMDVRHSQLFVLLPLLGAGL